MDDFSLPRRVVIRASGLLNGFLYFSTRRRFLGFTISGWLKFLPLLLAFIALLGRWPFLWIVVGLVLAVAVRVLYWNAKRRGYISFIPIASQAVPDEARPIPDNEKLPALATGLFSVIDKESYVLQRPAEYWRAPVGDHAIMVEHVPGRYLYQFVKAGTLKQVEYGYLVFGARPVEALSITFRSTWGPQFSENEQSQYMSSKNEKSGHLRRTAYLTFDDRILRQSVWQNLLRDAPQPVDEEH